MPKPPIKIENPLPAHPSPAPPVAADAVEDELNALIGEAGAIIRDVVVPSAMQCDDRCDRIAFFCEAVNLMHAASKLGDTIARLRGGGIAETRHRMVFEHMTRTTLPPAGEP